MYIQERPNGAFLLRVKNKLLPKGQVFRTFDTREQAQDFGSRLEALLEKGIVPAELLLVEQKSEKDISLKELMESYKAGNRSISDTDKELVGYVINDVATYRTSDVTYRWASDLAERFRVNRNLAPSTIRARIGVLKRAWDWYHAHNATGIKENPMSMLPDGYSIASESEREKIRQNGGESKRDVERDRRISGDEFLRIRRVLKGEKLRDDVQRALKYDREMDIMFRLLCNTGLRMREAYRLTKSSVDFKAMQLRVNGSKGHRGQDKPRNVYMVRRVRVMLRLWVKMLPEGEQRLFPGIWDGRTTKKDMKATSNRLSQDFARVFKHSMVDDLKEHDLRHEATCRWVLLERTGSPGVYALDPAQIAKLMGWTSLRLFLRYASLRGDDIANQLDGL